MRVALLVRETCSARDAVGRTSALGRGRPEQAVGRLGRNARTHPPRRSGRIPPLETGARRETARVGLDLGRRRPSLPSLSPSGKGETTSRRSSSAHGATLRAASRRRGRECDLSWSFHPTLRQAWPRDCTRGRNVRSRCRCSMCPAIHINSRSWLRPSSTREPSDPPLRGVLFVLRFSQSPVSRPFPAAPPRIRGGRPRDKRATTVALGFTDSGRPYPPLDTPRALVEEGGGRIH